MLEPMSSRWATPKEVAAALRFSLDYVYRQCRDGLWLTWRNGRDGDWRIRVDELDRPVAPRKGRGR